MGGCLGDHTIAAYVDGALDLAAVARVDHHIDACATCRTQLSALAASPIVHSFVAGAEAEAEADVASSRSITGVDRDPRFAAVRVGDPVADVVLGRYTVEAVIGRGAMGVVVRARDPELQRAVAIKLVDPAGRGALDATESGAWRSRLRAEARAMARLRHPNVVAVYDAGAAGDQLFVAMELVDGESLTRRIARDRTGVLALCIGAGRGLCAAHAAGLIHGDVKPDNILIDRDGRALIGDFGLARAIGDRAPAGDGPMLVGTPAYMAPERLRGAPADPASDQFAFAVTVYEAFAGARPWRATSIAALRDAVEREPPVRPPAMPRRVWGVVARGLAVDPAARHRSMAAMVAALERAGRGRGIWIAGGAGLAVAGVAIVALVAGSAGTPVTCADPIEAAGAMTRPALCGSPPAPWCQAVVAELAARAEAWRAAHVVVCRATRDGRQSADLLDRRMRCLDQRRLEVSAVASGLAVPPARPAALEAVTALHRLEAPDACITSDRPAGTIPAGKAAAIAEAHGWVAAARAEYALGHYRAGAAALAARFDAIRALAYPSLSALAANVLGELQVQAGDLDAAEASFDLGLRAAAEAGDDAASAAAMLDLAHLLGESRQQWERAAELVRAAEATVVRAGKPPTLEAAWLLTRGAVAESRGDFAAAITDYTRALALERAHADPIDLAIVLQRLSTAEHQAGKYEDAFAHAEEALALLRRALGDDHPLTAEAEINLGVTEAISGDLVAARRRWEAVLGRLDRGGGVAAPALAIVLIDLQDAARERGDLAAAEKYLARALEVTAGAATDPESLDVRIRIASQLAARGKRAEAIAMLEDLAARAEATLGPNHRTTAHAVDELGMAYYLAERWADARAAWTKAIASSTALYGERNRSTLGIAGALGQAMMMMNDPAAAQPVFEHALLVLEATEPEGSGALAEALLNVADSDGALGHAERAIERAQKALAIREARGDDPLQTAEARFVLARAMWAATRDRRAIALARTARDEMRAIGPEATTLPEVERWLAGR